MKRIVSLLLSFCMIFILGVNKNSYASSTDMQAAWITTVYNADWPSVKNNPTKQKEEMIKILDTLKDMGIDTVMFQARTEGDALYKSKINPWSKVLTGTQGKDPGYDPLEFVIEEAHKRGMKVHAWLNPYRGTTSGTDINALSTNHQLRKNLSWKLEHDGRLYFNPELPEVKQYIVDTVAEIVSNYNVDGIHFDDYFYPSKYPLTNGDRDGDEANARRNHITEMIKQVKSKIKSIKPYVEFGISPSGIWKNKSSDALGSNTRGNESYYSDFADTRMWVKNNLVDYIVPQLYWEIGNTYADYETLVKWWSDVVKGTNVDLYIGQGIYKDEVANQIDTQLAINKKYSSVKGSVYYTTEDIMNNIGDCRNKIKNFLIENKIPQDIKGHWAYDSIKQFIEKGYISGYEDKTFKPNNSITRAEFVKIVNKVFNFTEQGKENFKDIESDKWYYEDICIGVRAGYINGYEDGTFRPNEPISREEAASIISTITNLSGNSSLKFVDDNKIGAWAKSSVYALAENKIMTGYEDNTFRPKNKITRAEAVATLSRVK